MFKYLLVSFIAVGTVTNFLSISIAAGNAELDEKHLLHSLMPVPKKMKLEKENLPITDDFSISFGEYCDSRLVRAARRLVSHLEKQTGIPMPATVPAVGGNATLKIHCLGPGEKVQSVSEDESYELVITQSSAILTSNTVVGALRGLATFEQMVQIGPRGFFCSVAKISDSPRFPWRGLLIDVSRHWQPIDVIKRNLDGMAAVKLNVLHLHASDDQGFRVQSKLYPLLHKSGSDGNYYTQEEIKAIVAYARDRGIRIVPEFDVPGHSTSWLGIQSWQPARGPLALVAEAEFTILVWILQKMRFMFSLMDFSEKWRLSFLMNIYISVAMK